MSSHWLKIGAVLSALSAAHSQGACLWWYESTAHGEAFRNAKDFGAVGDGVHDDTAAIQAALDYNQTGGAGSNLAKSPAVVYLPAGDYLISDTLVLWYYGHLLGNAVCPPTIRVAPSSRGFEGPALKPVIATAGGFNVSTASHAWWLQAPLEGGAANCLFYAHMRDLLIVVGPGNGGAVGILWDVAQQTSIRNVTVDLRLSGSIGIDEGGVGCEWGRLEKDALPRSIVHRRYALPLDAELPDGQSTGAGGGGTIEDVTILGGAYGLRIDASQVCLLR